MQRSADLHGLIAPWRRAPIVPSLVVARAPVTFFNAYAQGAPGPGLHRYGLIDAAVGRFEGEGAAAGVNARDRGIAKVDGGVVLMLMRDQARTRTTGASSQVLEARACAIGSDTASAIQGETQ
ncbi:hypothetical protein [uncultured Comamonas sp.]|uniref:hypothetical protein n=1 Tax=uncultured Comamonas sp. TaxID=114710 RepID=UPI0025D96316|nr:hypothetical protein [uncultured Comamonas sp.]